MRHPSRFKAIAGRLAACRSGASAVEFSIVAIPLFLVLFGTVEYGRAMWIRQAISETAIAGARCMGVAQSQCAEEGTFDAAKTRTFVVDTAQGWYVALKASNVEIDRNATCAGVAGFSRVTIDYRFESAVPTLIEALSAGVPLSTSACFPNQS